MEPLYKEHIGTLETVLYIEVVLIPLINLVMVGLQVFTEIAVPEVKSPRKRRRSSKKRTYLLQEITLEVSESVKMSFKLPQLIELSRVNCLLPVSVLQLT